MVNITLRGLLASYKAIEIIEGCAAGADRCGEVFAKENGIAIQHFPADWGGNGKAAGPIRNQQMLDEGKPDVVVAFKDYFNLNRGRGGTEDMIRRAKAAGVPAYVISHGDEV